MDGSFNIDDELLQWLTNLPPSSPPPQCGDSQPPVSTTCPIIEGSNLRVNALGGNLMVDTRSQVDGLPAHSVATHTAGSSSSKDKQHQSNKKAVEIERQRRHEMSSLYASLRSILPAEYIGGKRSTADHLQQAVRYIKDMEGNIAQLNEKKDTLLKGKSRGSCSTRADNNTSSGNSNRRRLYTVTVKKSGEGFFEIVLKTNADDYEENVHRLPLSKGLRLLNREGLSITNSISTKIGNDVMHTIHAQVDDGMVIDQCLLQQQLIDCYV
ncbi:transcription factor bHLH118-like [Silene latifolia]|uniref:transcription factor bHLH118-like n=1 Tax=Silene latifolia TaxID=37657 RepID=UPI003D77294E